MAVIVFSLVSVILAFLMKKFRPLAQFLKYKVFNWISLSYFAICIYLWFVWVTYSPSIALKVQFEKLFIVNGGRKETKNR